MKDKTEKKIVSGVDDLIKENNQLEKKLKKYEERIHFLEGSEYGSSLINNGVEKACWSIIKLLQKYPRSDNIIYKERLCSTDFIIKQEILQLKERIKVKG